MHDIKKNIDVSFVVPAYNMEKYLIPCITSIFKQESLAYEILIIDDGSTDSTSELANKFIEANPNITCICKLNSGISSARNMGIDFAAGKYICFIDSDDFYKCSFAKNFFNLCELNQLDIIRGWYGIYDESSDSFISHCIPPISYFDYVLSGEEFLEKSINEHSNEVVPWLGFFKREFLKSHQLYFPSGIAYEEDQLFFLDALLCDPQCRVMQVPFEFYAYRKRPGSATKTPTIKQAKDIIYVVEQETALLSKYNIFSKPVLVAAKRYICSSFYQLTSIYGRVSNDDRNAIAKMAPFRMKVQCIKYPYDMHQLIKILLFTFCRNVVDFVYDQTSDKRM